MHLLGLDIFDGKVRGVVVDGDGTSVRRADCLGTDPKGALVAELTEGLTIGAFGLAIDPAVLQDHDKRRFGKTRKLPAPTRCTPNAAAVTAESWIGGAQGTRHAVCLWIGDRVFAGILLNGASWSGAHGFAGSAAWLALNPVERQDYRAVGSLAAEVSNKGIARRLAWRIQAGDRSSVLERAGDLDSITATHVFDGAREGDGVSISVVRETAKYIGMAVANLAGAIDPEMIVLGGAAAAAGDLLFEPVRQEVGRRLHPGMVDRVGFAISPLAEDGVAIGAARIAARAGA